MSTVNETPESPTGSLLQRPTAKVVLDTVSPDGARITTFQVGLWAPVTPELLRHRAFSFSFSSLRAIPFAKMLEQVRTKPAGPNYWGTNQRGMRMGEQVGDPRALERMWIENARVVAGLAEPYNAANLQKSIPSRLLYPFITMHGLVTATDFANFYALRTEAAADPIMHELSWRMWDAHQASTPVARSLHAPFATEEEVQHAFFASDDSARTLAFATAMRCARLSYAKLDGAPSTVEEDARDAAEKLAGPQHMSPFEHFAIAEGARLRYANFRGWQSARAAYFPMSPEGAGVREGVREENRFAFDPTGYRAA